MIFTFFQDTLGRKKVILAGFGIGCVGFFCICFGQFVQVKVFGVMLLWSLVEIFFGSFILLSNELLVNPLRNSSVALYGMMTCIGGLVGNLATFFLKDYTSMIVVNFAGHCISFLLVSSFLHQSPSYLLKQARLADLRKVIRKMCASNGLSRENVLEVEDLLEVVIESKSLICRRDDFQICN